MTISGELRDVWEDSGVCWAWWLLMVMYWAELTRAKYCAVQLINCCCLEACTLLHVSLLWTSLWLQITGDQGKQCHLWFQLIGYGNCVGTSVGKKQRWPWFEPLQGSGLFPGGTIGAMVGLNTSEFPYTEISWLVKWVLNPYMVWMDVMLLLWWTIGCSMTCWHDCGNLNKLWATSIDQVNESWWNQLNVWTRMLSDCGDWFNPVVVEGIWATRFPPDCHKSYDSCWTVRVLLAHLMEYQQTCYSLMEGSSGTMEDYWFNIGEVGY